MVFLFEGGGTHELGREEEGERENPQKISSPAQTPAAEFDLTTLRS